MVNSFQHNDAFLTGLGKKPFENIVEKGEIACTSNFSFSHNVFSSIKDRNYHFLLYFNLSSANAFNLVLSKILLCGNGLNKLLLLKCSCILTIAVANKILLSFGNILRSFVNENGIPDNMLACHF